MPSSDFYTYISCSDRSIGGWTFSKWVYKTRRENFTLEIHLSCLNHIKSLMRYLKCFPFFYLSPKLHFMLADLCLHFLAGWWGGGLWRWRTMGEGKSSVILLMPNCCLKVHLNPQGRPVFEDTGLLSNVVWASVRYCPSASVTPKLWSMSYFQVGY